MKESLSINIAMGVPEKVAKEAKLLSHKFKNKSGLFVLGDKTFVPHITLYMTEFPEKNLPKIIELLGELAVKTKPFKMKAIEYRKSSDGYIDVSYERSKAILDLQNKLVKKLNKYREGLVIADHKKLLKFFKPLEAKNFNKYGYGSIGSCYNPHLTFTRLGEVDTKVNFPTKMNQFSFTLDRLIISIMGMHGTHKKVLAVIKL